MAALRRYLNRIQATKIQASHGSLAVIALYIIIVHRKASGMVKTQIYLTKREHDGIRRMAARNGMTQSQIIRAAVDHWLRHNGLKSRVQLLESVAGIWRDRTDLPDFAALRQEADRISPPRRP